MLLPIPDVLTADQVRYVRERLEGAGDAWVDGRATAGYQGAPVKRNQQIAEHSPVARELGDVIVGAIESPTARSSPIAAGSIPISSRTQSLRNAM